MKYVRVIDGSIYTKEFWQELVDYAQEKGRSIEDMAVKEADTIEELCDAFVCVRKRDNEHYSTTDKKIFDYWYLDKDFVNCDWYGAIWTDKGLIYVAKMTEKGEWELL